MKQLIGGFSFVFFFAVSVFAQTNRPALPTTGVATVPEHVHRTSPAVVRLYGTNGSPTVAVQQLSAVQKIRILRDQADADFGLHKVQFDGGLQSVGITTPDNRSLYFRPLLLAYYDSASGDAVLLAQVLDTAGAVEFPNRVTYEQAFDDLDADVQYDCTANSLEQNIVLHQDLPSPAQFGLNTNTTRLEVWTEWYQTPPVAGQTSPISLRDGVVADDTALDFGTMKIVRGRAFNLDGTGDAIPVAKQWMQIGSRRFLVEAVDYRAVQNQLAGLPPGQTAKAKSFSHPADLIAALDQPDHHPRSMLLARADKETKGVVLDFAMFSSAPLPQGAIAWWPGGGDADDIVGGYNGTYYDGTYAAGEVGQAFNMNATNGYVEVPDDDVWAFGGDFTIEFWASFSAYPSADETQPQGGIFISSDEGGGGTAKWFFALAGGVLNFHINDPDNGAVFLVNAPFTPVTNTWYHYAITRQGTTYTVYVNGQAIGTDTCDRAIPNADASLMIGQAEGFYLFGKMDEVKIYNRALSGSEIASIYSAGGAGKDNQACVNPADTTVGWWSGDGNAYDLVYTNNGTLVAGSYTDSEVGKGFQFNGDSSYVQVPRSDRWAFGTNDFTIELWANFADYLQDNIGGPDGGALVSSDEGGGERAKWFFAAGSGVLGFHINDPTNGPLFLVSASFDPDPNTWYHLALTRSNQVFTFFVNGQPIGSQTNSRAIPIVNAPLMIGQAEGFMYYGGLDEVTIYRTALSPSQISAIYSAGTAGKCKSDVNFNGIPDSWERKYFGNLLQTATGDYDNDGTNNLTEFQNSSDPNNIDFTLTTTNYDVTKTNVLVRVNLLGGVPSYQAVVLNSSNFTAVTWSAYTSSNLTVNLGSLSNSVYTVWVGLRGLPSDGAQTWRPLRLVMDTNPPVLTITDPVLSSSGTASTGIPLVQIQGWANENLSRVSFVLSNAITYRTNGLAMVLDRFYDTNTWRYTTNYFQCFDLALTNGLNRVIVRAVDLAGNVTTTNLSITLDYSLRTNPPVVSLVFPQNGMKVGGTNFTANGYVDDPTARVQVRLTDSSGRTNYFNGDVEATGRFWVDDMPLVAGTNYLAYTITDAAGNVATTNIAIVQSSVTLTMNPVSDEAIWKYKASVSGTVSDPNAVVWINGVQASNSGGNWSAGDVPITPGGVAIFNMTAYPSSEAPSSASGTNGVNPSSPNSSTQQQAPNKPDTVGLVIKADSQDWHENRHVFADTWDEARTNHIETDIQDDTHSVWEQWVDGIGCYSNRTTTKVTMAGLDNQNNWVTNLFADMTNLVSGTNYSTVLFPVSNGKSGEYCKETVMNVATNYGATANGYWGTNTSTWHFDHEAQTKFKLLTGGRRDPQSQVLHELHGWVKDVSIHGPHNYRQYLLLLTGQPYGEGVPTDLGSQIPAPMDSVCIGSLGGLSDDPLNWAEGLLYAVTTAGSEVDATPVWGDNTFYVFYLREHVVTGR